MKLASLSLFATLAAAVLCLHPVPVYAADAKVPRQPNFIIINIDDLGYSDIGPFGGTTPTPNLDRMAKEGMKLTSHYAAPVCSPSRASLMTGCYPKRVLPIPGVLFPAAAVGLNPEEETIAEVLKQAGYATTCIGKWHLGDQKPFLPTSQGFDSYYGIPYSNDMGPGPDGAKSNPDKPLPTGEQMQKRAANPKNANSGDDGTGVRGMQPPQPMVENDKVVGRVRPEGQFAFTRQYADRAVKYIREHKDKPFFLYLPHNAVHFPLYPSKDFRGKSPNGLLGDWVMEVDWCVGQVLDTLRELGLEKDTLVIFTSDNGGTPGENASNKPLRGHKTQTFEGGVRVCTIAWWPGKVAAGTSTNAITSMMDVLPTLATLGRAKLPEKRKLDGVDISGVLLGTAGEKGPRDHYFFFRGPVLEAVRSGPWKLHFALRTPAGKGAKGAPVPPGKPHMELFNLEEDIGETTNVLDAHPDVVKRLQDMAASMEGDLGTKEFGPGCRPLGRVENPQPFIGMDGSVREDAVGQVKSFP